MVFMVQELHLTRLDPQRPDEPFPPVELAWTAPNGLIAVGGDLDPNRLLNAYRSGIFPWFNDDQPIYWWSPDPRGVLFPERIHLTRSLRKSIRNKGYLITIDQAFADVIYACALPRRYCRDTWITDAMQKAYGHLHQLGIAHSFEVWNPQGDLVGGLYGVVTGGIFNGESMFSTEPDTSKIALTALCYSAQQWGFKVIDCQMPNPYLLSMGAETISRANYIHYLQACRNTPPKATWKVEFNNEILSQWQPQ
jgi:leucyl/phenylalanyl-tRNA--protein transferase